MKPRRIVLADNFRSALSNFGATERDRIQQAIRQFRDRGAENALRPTLKEGLKCWAFRVPGSGGIRVFYEQRTDTEGRYALLFHVGRHDDYRTVQRRLPK